MVALYGILQIAEESRRAQQLYLGQLVRRQMALYLSAAVIACCQNSTEVAAAMQGLAAMTMAMAIHAPRERRARRTIVRSACGLKV